MSVFIHFLKWRLGLTGPEVWTTETERACLARYAAGKRRLVEIGVWHGGTSKILRTAMARDGVFYAVDPYEPGRLGFSFPRLVGHGEVERVQNGRVVWVRDMGAAAAASDDMHGAAPFDFVFIDAAQTYDALDAEWRVWAPLIAPDGIIALHDSLQMAGETGPEQTSVAFVREVVMADPRFMLREAVDTLSVLQRRESACRAAHVP